jgi:predicted phosphohydrolase
VVIVATVRALKMHGGLSKTELGHENLEALSRGVPNLLRHVKNIKEVYKLPLVVAVNKFPTDTDAEINLLIDECKKLSVNVVLSTVWADGGRGGEALAREVVRLGLSLDEGLRLREEAKAQDGKEREMLAFLHFPPIFKGYMCDEIIMELYKKEVSRCFFGHIHGSYDSPMKVNYADIDFYFISADYLAFRPYKIEPKL